MKVETQNQPLMQRSIPVILIALVGTKTVWKHLIFVIRFITIQKQFFRPCSVYHTMEPAVPISANNQFIGSLFISGSISIPGIYISHVSFSKLSPKTEM